MRNSYLVIACLFTALSVSCTTSSLSRKQIESMASSLSYVTVPASVVGTAKDVKVHYEEAGAAGAPVMILIHGFTSSTITWKECLPALSKHYHVFALDMPGWGFSDKPADFPYGLDGYPKVVINFMDQKGIDKAILGGNSMGGGVSLYTTINNPERVTHLILIDAAGYPMNGPKLVRWTTKSWMRPFAKPFFGKWILRMGLKQVYYDDKKVTPELVELYGRPFMMKNGKDVPFWFFQNFSERDLEKESKRIPGVKVPTLIIWGENDAWVPLEHAKFFHRDIKGSELVIIPECGHLPEEEKPKEVVKAILDFL